MPWYKTGTVSVTQNSNAVIGTGTAFIANSRVGDGFRGPDGRWYEVTNIASNTALSISPNYEGPTAAGGFYAIMPVQGYQKDLSDQVRTILNDYGETLAALGTTGNYDVLPVTKGGTGGTDPAAARSSLGLGSVATENVVPVAKGGTGGTDQAGARAGLGLGSVATESTVPISKGGTGATTASAGRTALGLGSAAVAQIVGTVSQSGGLPTGALMEYGTNSGGEFWKFASGLMICAKKVALGPTSFAAGPIFTCVSSAVGAMPAVFAANPYVVANGISDASGGGWGSCYVNWSASTWGSWAIYTEVSRTSASTLNLIAIGKWFV
ncbi:phage tail protein [Pseudomonas sp. Sample_14]|uniref:phage tail protein n=1 Tax=Pseudomonas sp. Sample_14 TaxID=2448262 RepID=UPI001F4FE709|nr:phage tail protein [Pseudomonas sp. Sample_14]